MGTRGVMAFAVNGETKVTYNQFDSYPDGLGLEMLHFAQQLAESGDLFDEYRVKADRLRAVSEEDAPTDEDFARFSALHDSGVSTGRDWYALLRAAQGRPALALDAGVYLDSQDFAADSLFCEWGYVLDFDARTLEVYRGFQDEPHTDGRFHAMTPLAIRGASCTYYPIRLLLTYELAQLPDPSDFTYELDRLAYGDDDDA